MRVEVRHKTFSNLNYICQDTRDGFICGFCGQLGLLPLIRSKCSRCKAKVIRVNDVYDITQEIKKVKITKKIRKPKIRILPGLSTKKEKQNAKIIEKILDWQMEQIEKNETLSRRFYRLVFKKSMGLDIKNELIELMKDAKIL